MVAVRGPRHFACRKGEALPENQTGLTAMAAREGVSPVSCMSDEHWVKKSKIPTSSTPSHERCRRGR